MKAIVHLKRAIFRWNVGHEGEIVRRAIRRNDHVSQYILYLPGCLQAQSLEGIARNLHESGHPPMSFSSQLEEVQSMHETRVIVFLDERSYHK